MYIERIMMLKPQVRKTFGFYAAMMAKFGFPTSSRYNALHGPLALAGLVASMAYNRSCGNKAAKLLVLSAVEAVGDDDCIRSAHLPTSQWALGLIARLDHNRMEGGGACNAAFHACTGASRRRGMIPERPVGMMDGHSTAYYGKKGNKSFIIKSRKKDGTTKFNVFLSSAIRAGPYLLHTAMHRMRRGEPMADYIKGILDQNRGSGVYCDHWLVDRMFFSVAAMSEFGRADEYFLMYAKMTPGIKKALAEYEDGKRGAVSEYIVKSGRAKFTGVLAFVKKAKTKEDGTREEMVLPFFSNMPRHRLEAALRALPSEMKKRWIQECVPVVPDNSAHPETVPFGELRYGSEEEAADKVSAALDGKYDGLLAPLRDHMQRFSEGAFQEGMMGVIGNPNAGGAAFSGPPPRRAAGTL